MPRLPLNDAQRMAQRAAILFGEGKPYDTVVASLRDLAPGATPQALADALNTGAVATDYGRAVAAQDWAKATQLQAQLEAGGAGGLIVLAKVQVIPEEPPPGFLPRNLGEGPGEPAYRSVQLAVPQGASPQDVLALLTAMGNQLISTTCDTRNFAGGQLGDITIESAVGR